MLSDVPVVDLPMFWEGRSRALHMLNTRSPNEVTRAVAEAYKECADELRAALANGDLYREEASVGQSEGNK